MMYEGALKCTNDAVDSFEALRNQKFILYAYPKDNTSGCTFEALAFAEHYDAFKALGYEVIGVSKDTLGTHKNFIKKHNLPFSLISDVERELLAHFDLVVEKKMYGKPVKGTQRSTFVFHEGLELVKAFREVDPKTHVPEVLAFVRNLG